jgi:hypothetical protein
VPDDELQNNTGFTTLQHDFRNNESQLLTTDDELGEKEKRRN